MIYYNRRRNVFQIYEGFNPDFKPILRFGKDFLVKYIFWLFYGLTFVKLGNCEPKIFHSLFKCISLGSAATTH